MSAWKSFGVAMVLLIVLAFFMVTLAFAVDVTESDNTRKLLYNNVPRGDDQGIISQYLRAYQIDQPDTTNTYIRFAGGDDNVFIVRISVVGTVTTIEKCTTNWDSRVTGIYIPINDNE